MASEREIVIRGGGATPWHALRDLAFNLNGMARVTPNVAADQAIGHEIAVRLVCVPKGSTPLIAETTYVAEARWHVAA